MTYQAASALIEAGGFHGWEPGYYDPETGLFAYQAWTSNRPVARVVGPKPSPNGRYLSVVDLEGNPLT